MNSLGTENENFEFVEIPRRLVYGQGAINRLKSVCKEMGVKHIFFVSGKTYTAKIAENTVIPTLINDFELDHIKINEEDHEELLSISKEIQGSGAVLLGCGGGRVIDKAKLLASWSSSPFITVPTSVANDGFVSPYLNFLLRREIQTASNSETLPKYRPTTPLAVVGDTKLISQAPYESLLAGVGDLVAKFVAAQDWELSHRITGEKFDVYASVFGLMSARLVEKNVDQIAKGQVSESQRELGVRTIIKAQGNSGVAMSLAGSSRPASGSEHLVSHSLDLLSTEYGYTIPHGFQCGLASIIMLFLHRGEWRNIKSILEKVGAPTTVHELGIEREILIEALMNAHKIRDRHTILGAGLTREAAERAIEATGVA